MNEIFILPNQWCIKARTAYEAEIIASYATPLEIESKLGPGWEPRHCFTYYLHIRENKYYSGSKDINYGFTEISFEQFSKYVLNESNDYNLEYLIPFIDKINRL